MSISAGTRLGRYKVLSAIGAGGMGAVYMAEDTELERTVALKILLPDVAGDQQRMARFIQEAKAASALNHPNILTIYEIGRAEQSAFIATELIKGVTLRERMSSGQSLKITEALEIIIQAASALQSAHEAGIVHRDIKPENIMVRADGYVKVLDFGLAKLTEKANAPSIDAEAVTRALVNTEPGKVMGTVAYMSPEQARGAEVDSRTDVWSLGCVLYEMIAGTRPFQGATPTDVILSIIEKEPPPLARFSREVPEALEWMVAKALMKERDERYQTVRELMTDLRRLLKRMEFEAELERSVPPGAGLSSATVSHQSLGNQPTILNTEARERRADTRDAEPASTLDANSARSTSTVEVAGRDTMRRKRSVVIAAVASLVALAALASLIYIYARGRAASSAAAAHIDSIAVMPFVNVGGDPNTEYLSDGLTESIINSLTQLPNLTVMARSTVFRYKGKDADPQQVARDLKVKAVLTGRVIQRGDALSISAELVDAGTGRQIWGEQYNRKLTDLLAVQEEISRQISEKLRVRLTGEEQKQTARRSTANTEAYQLYLRGRYHWNRRSEDDIRKSIEYFQQAIALDPSYALAYAGLADAYQVLPSYSKIEPDEAYPKARAAAQKALEIDGTMAEPHASLAVVKYEYEWDFPGAEREYRRAIELNPNYASAHQWYAEFLSAMLRHDEAEREIRRALELDPLSIIINSIAGVIYLNMRQPDKAAEQLKKAIALEPNFARTHLFLSFAYEDKGTFEEAIQEFQKTTMLTGTPPDVAEKLAGALREAYKTGGVKGYWQKKVEIAEDFYRRGADIPPTALAAVHARAGDHERALEWLEKAYRQRDATLPSIRNDPGFDALRSDARYVEILRRVGLPQ
ncbi:MAG TPA: protein kinase [Pyrinomonadaceae bacterium]|nr:protein kinase [Pyrinomonadaceae bacterium]